MSINDICQFQRLFFFQIEAFESWCAPFPGGSVVKNQPADAEGAVSIPGLGRSPTVGNVGYSSILAWKTLWTEEPGGLQSMELQTVGHD